MEELITSLMLGFDQNILSEVTGVDAQVSQLTLHSHQFQLCCSQKPSNDDVFRVQGKLCPEIDILETEWEIISVIQFTAVSPGTQHS